MLIFNTEHSNHKITVNKVNVKLDYPRGYHFNLLQGIVSDLVTNFMFVYLYLSNYIERVPAYLMLTDVTDSKK